MEKRSKDYKTLPEMIKDIPGERTVKIGAKDGSGFFFVGSNKYLVENLEDISARVWNETVRMKNQAEKEFQTYRTGNAASIKIYINQELRKDEPNFTTEGYMRFLAAFFHTMQVKRGTMVRRVNDWRNYIHLEAREIVDMFEADPVVDDAVIIIVTGTELGAYWTSDEVTEPVRFGKPQEKTLLRPADFEEDW